MMKKVIIEVDENDMYSIYDEGGGAVEVDFESEQEAIDFAQDQCWNVVNSFNL